MMIIDLNCMLYLRPLESLHLPRKYINYLSYFFFFNVQNSNVYGPQVCLSGQDSFAYGSRD